MVFPEPLRPSSTSVSPLTISRLAGASAWGIGEDLFWGAATLSTPKATVNAWMHSAPHRAVLLSRSFRQVGVGVDHGSPAGADNTNTGTYTALFGYRKGG